MNPIFRRLISKFQVQNTSSKNAHQVSNILYRFGRFPTNICTQATHLYAEHLALKIQKCDSKFLEVNPCFENQSVSLYVGLTLKRYGNALRHDSLFCSDLALACTLFNPFDDVINYRSGQPNWVYTVWKFQDFSATLIVPETNLVNLKLKKLSFLSI